MPPPINRTMTPTEWALLLSLAVIWAGSYFYNAIALSAVPPISVVAFRVGLGGLILYLAVRLRGGRMPTDWRIWAAFVVMGILNNVVPFSLIAWSQTHIASGLASILNATTPLFTVVIAQYLTHDEHMTPARITGVIIGIASVTILIGADALAQAGAHLLPELAALTASVLYAFSAIYGRRFSRLGVPPLTAAAGQIGSSALIMIPLALIIDQPWTLPMPSVGVWAALVALAALATGLAYLIYYRVLATAGSVNLMLVTFLIPVGAVILGWLALGERLSPNHFVGMAGVFIGLALIDGRVLRLLRR